MSVDSEMEDEVAFKEFRLDAEETTPHTVSPQMVTTEALQNIVDNWKTKFQILSDGIRAAQVAAETCSANIEDLHRDSRNDADAARCAVSITRKQNAQRSVKSLIQ